MRRDTSWRVVVAALFVFLLVPWVARADWEQVGEAGFSAGETYSTKLAIDSSGTPYVAYMDVANGNKASVMRFNGTAWEQVGAAGFSTDKVEHISLALDSGGRLYVAYQDGANGNKASVMKFDGSAWTQVGVAGFSPDMVENTSLAFDSSDTPYVAYQDWANDRKASVMRFNSATSSWEQVGVAGFSIGATLYTNLAIDSSGMPYVAYEDVANDYKASVMRFNSATSSWEQVGAAGFSIGGAGMPSFALDSSDTPYVAYEDFANDKKVSVMRFNGTDWEQVGMAGFSPSATYYISVTFDSGGTPYVAYEDSANGYKASVMRFNGTAWEQVGMAGFSKGAVQNTSLAFDSSGTPYVAYTDYANGDKASVMKFVATTLSCHDTALAKLQEAMAAVQALPPAAFKTSNMQHGFVNQINTAILRVKRGKYAEALHLVRGGILVKTDGCAKAGAPDKNDWLKDCADQANVYQLLQDAIECLQSMM
jgi:hypothetical protein